MGLPGRPRDVVAGSDATAIVGACRFATPGGSVRWLDSGKAQVNGGRTGAGAVSSSSSGHQLVFVGGLHRSGTTLVADLLSRHPDGSGLTATGVEEDEGQHLQDVYPVARSYGGTGRFARDPFAHLTERSPLATPANARRILAAWEPFWDLDKHYLVEKSPPNLIMGRYLQALYPDAAFVFVARHPVVVSLATRKWRPRTPFARLLEHWFLAHDTARSDLAHLRRVHVLKYEDLVSRPDATLSDLAGFLGMSSPLDAASVDVTRSTRYATTWQQERSSADRRVRARAERCIDRFGERTREYGYDIVDLDVVRPFPRGPAAP